jgi:hypothetical protein
MGSHRQTFCKTACLFLAMNLMTGIAHGEHTGEAKTYPLEGIFFLGGTECETAKAGACAVYFELDGEAAKLVYENMRSKAKTDLCTEGFMKTDDTGLHCYRSGSGEHGCYFGYDFARSRIVEGDFSC